MSLAFMQTDLSQLGTTWTDVMKLLFILAAVVLLAYLSIRHLLPRVTMMQTSQPGLVQVISRHPLEPRKNLYIVRAGEEFLLIGASDNAIQLLTRIPPEQVALVETKKPPVEFARVLEKWRKRS